MDRISIESPQLFTRETYNQYLESRKAMENERYRKPDETIFDALLSPEADFTKRENASDVIEAIGQVGKL